MLNFLFKSAVILVIVHVTGVLTANIEPDDYLLTIHIDRSQYGPLTAGIIRQHLCFGIQSNNNKVRCKYTFKVIGEDIIVAALQVKDPIELEKRFNVVKYLAVVNIRTERLTKYEDFADTILKVNKTLLEPSGNTPEDVIELNWCEVNIGYEGTLSELVEVWKQEAEILLASRASGTKRDLFKVMAKNKVHLFTEATALQLDASLFVLPMFVNNGANVQITCKRVLNLDYYITKAKNMN